MLKIRDDIDIKELEKFNYYDYNENKEYKNPYYTFDSFYIFVKSRRIQPKSNLGIDRYDVLFDLIQAGLVEKEKQYTLFDLDYYDNFSKTIKLVSEGEQKC